MVLNSILSQRIVAASSAYIGKPFCYSTYNCIHFVRNVYSDVGIIFPLVERYGLPPQEFHVSPEVFMTMPHGHSVFFKRKESQVQRYWTHVGIIFDLHHVIHCTRHTGKGVVVTPVEEFLKTYALAWYRLS